MKRLKKIGKALKVVLLSMAHMDLQIDMKLNVKKHSVIAIILAVCGFVMVYAGATVTSIFFLATIVHG